jgi:cytochrome c1
MGKTNIRPLAIWAAAAFFAAGCDKKTVTSVDAGPTAPISMVPPEPLGDSVRGHAAIEKYECNRCHAVEGIVAAAPQKHCVSCHTEIVEGRFVAKDPAKTAEWKASVYDLDVAPSLIAVGKRLRGGAVVNYLMQPHDLRPNLAANMPRLALSRSEARDIAAYLGATSEEDVVRSGDATAGRKAMESKGCGACHAFSGVAALPATPPAEPLSAKDFAVGKRLAPDLRFARDRMTFSKIVSWLRDPRGTKPDTKMPSIPLSEEEARDIASYLVNAKLEVQTPAPFRRLPPLERKVTYAEVDAKVFHKTCWHCHAEPDYAIGDGGPGNSGGFGFPARKLNLASYEGVAAGIVDDKGERSSIFSPGRDGTPRLLDALLARHREEEGATNGPVRGMPLGYAPLTAEQIQLVESWISQGRPR